MKRSVGATSKSRSICARLVELGVCRGCITANVADNSCMNSSMMAKGRTGEPFLVGLLDLARCESLTPSIGGVELRRGDL